MAHRLPTGYILQKEARERSRATKHLAESPNEKTDGEENHEVFLSVQETRTTTEPPHTRGAAHCTPHHPGDPRRSRGGALRLSPGSPTAATPPATPSATPSPGPAALTRRQRPRRGRDSAGRKRGAEPEPAQRAAPPRLPTWRPPAPFLSCLGLRGGETSGGYRKLAVAPQPRLGGAHVATARGGSEVALCQASAPDQVWESR